MANLIRLCSGLDNLAAKSLINWKLCCSSFEIHAVKCRFNNKWRHFATRKVISNAKEPLSLCKKIGIGVTTCIAVKAVGNNSVFCLAKSEASTRLSYITDGSLKKEPEFNWKKFFQLLWPYWPELIGAVFAAFICAMLSVQIPISLGQIIDILTKVSPSRESLINDIKKPALKVISYFTVQSFFTFMYICLLARVGEGVAKTMKMKLFSSVLDQDILFFDKNRSGEILNRLTVDVQEFKSSFKMIISQGLRNTIQIIGCTASLFYISRPMTGIMLIAIPTIILIGALVGSYLRKISYDSKAQNAKVTLIADEAISNIRTVRSFAMEEVEKKILDDEMELCKNLYTKLGCGIALFQAGTTLFLDGMVLGTIYLGGYMMAKDALTTGDLMAFLAAAQLLQRSFSQMSVLFGLYIRGKHAGARVFEIMDLPFGRTLWGGKTIPFHSLIPSVEFRNVNFTYPTRPNTPVLKDFNLTIPPGKTVALVGVSGSGKSTLMWLLQRFYDVDNGSILIAGEDVRNLNPKWLRKSVIGVISQEPVLFATSIKENIRYGKPSATDAEVMEAAKLANADDFIKDFPNGYDTLVGERGVTISGGQKQRIAIARALIKNPSILILDEATSALDSDSEKTLLSTLENVIESKTTIVIAHRLSTIKKADLIVVLHNGVVVEVGTHKELLSKSGVYSALVSQQINVDNGNEDEEKRI